MTSREFYGPGQGNVSSRGTVTGAKFSGGMKPYQSTSELNYEALRSRSRLAHWETPQARALTGRKTDNAVGAGLSLQVSPVWELLEPKVDKTDEDALNRRHKWKRDVELRFHLWANSHESDSTGRDSFYRLQYFELMNRDRDGETFVILRYSSGSSRMSPVSLQFVLPEQVTQPGNADITAARARGNVVKCGIELTQEGEEIAVFLCEDPIKSPSLTTRIPFFGTDGRRFVIHTALIDSVGCVRGTPSIAPYVHELQKITDASVSELEAMVVNSLFAVQHITEAGSAKGSNPAKALAEARARVSGSTYNEQDDLGKGLSNFPGLMVNPASGNKLESFDTKRPNLNVNEFIRNVFKSIAAAEGVGIAIADMEHNASYSAARGALLQFWTKIEILRDQAASQFWNVVYEAWFREEVSARRVKASLKTPIMTAAWLNCTWLGSSMPSINPLPEVQAVERRQALGHTTGQREAMKYNGSDFTENVSIQKTENKELSESRSPIVNLENGQIALPFGGAESITAPSTHSSLLNYGLQGGSKMH
jgi:capsid protein